MAFHLRLIFVLSPLRLLPWRVSCPQLLVAAELSEETCTTFLCGATDRGGGSRVALENKRPGSPATEWDINGAGDPSIQGFATDISVAAGATVHFKVRTDASAYRVDIYRMGFYSGHGARLVTSVLPHASLPQTQPNCLFDAATLLVDCVTWAESAQWQVPSDATSGIYFARLVRTDEEAAPKNWRGDHSPVRGDAKFAREGWDQSRAPESTMQSHGYGAAGHGKMRNALREPRASHIYFVVRDDSHSTAILIQTMDTTWQAYNCWGTTNTYGVACSDPAVHAGSPTPPNISRRAYKASYNRPFATRSYRASNMPFNAEYPLVRWLERNGYDVSYWTGVDADRFGERLLDPATQHKVYISVAHDEYWSGKQRSFVTGARARGTSLCFFSANEVYWRIRWEADMRGLENHRTLVVYKETQSTEKIDPLAEEWTGTFRDGRSINPLGAMPENALTGTIYAVNAWRNDFLTVPARYRHHRFWRNTSVALQAEGETLVMPVPGLLGHEWDEDIDNGFRPAGLARLSSTVVDNVQYIHDEGATYDSGTATHHLTLYRDPAQGALVFGAGTCQWSWGLDGHHDLVGGKDEQLGKNCYSLRVGVDQMVKDGNRDIQQATANLLADMGVLPTTPQAEPSLTYSTTSDGEAPRVEEEAEFWSGTTEGGVSEGHVAYFVGGTATDFGGGVVAAVELSEDGGHSWHPASALNSFTGRWTYRLAEVQGVAGLPPSKMLLARAADDSGHLSGETGLRLQPRAARRQM